MAAKESETRPEVNGEPLRVLTGRIFTAQVVFTDDMAVGDREEQARRLVRDESERSALIDALLNGRLFEQFSLWEAAMTKLVAPMLDCFAGLAADERANPVRDVKVWVENDGSLRKTGELLYCHPKTVRYRLNRIEQRTGRSVSRPRDIAELRRVM